MQLPKRITVLDGWVELLDVMGGDQAIVDAARVSRLGQSGGAERDRALLFSLIKRGHMTPFEMVDFKFRVKCPLFIARQWMRHRTGSYVEVSRRRVGTGLEFHVPQTWRGAASDSAELTDAYLKLLDQPKQF